MSTNKIIEILGDQSDFLLNHTCKTIDKSLLHIPSPNTIDEIWMSSDRNTRTLNSLQTILGHGRLANTGYVSILPVDQGVEHTAGASFAPNPEFHPIPVTRFFQFPDHIAFPVFPRSGRDGMTSRFCRPQTKTIMMFGSQHDGLEPSRL